MSVKKRQDHITLVIKQNDQKILKEVAEQIK
jgi:hypothetical protein